MELSNTEKQLLKHQLAERIQQGSFNKLVIQDKGNGFDCCVEGELFAVIGILSQLLLDMSKESGMPVNMVITYLTLAIEIVEELTGMMGEQQSSPEFARFMDILTGGKEGNN